MKHYTKICPVCGTVNKDLYLEETDGWMECEKCHKSVKVEDFERAVLTPIYSIKNEVKVCGIPAGAETAK